MGAGAFSGLSDAAYLRCDGAQKKSSSCTRVMQAKHGSLR
jgi:hypothetical protein